MTLPDIADKSREPDSIQDIAGYLQSCSLEVFRILRQSIPSREAFRQAARLLSPERRSIIGQWESELA
ncbi:hypothetical protein [Coleofasciculus sp.]|uniref:hypothetical protein n=1 Tax=Coleofasciculus sp. TaxID=3100458 RepID=UPI0039F7B0B8